MTFSNVLSFDWLMGSVSASQFAEIVNSGEQNLPRNQSTIYEKVTSTLYNSTFHHKAMVRLSYHI